MNNIILINPNISLANTESYYHDESLENITKLIRNFDTGITDIKTKKISVEEMGNIVPLPIMQDIFGKIKSELQNLENKGIQFTWRIDDGFFIIRVDKNSEPEITTLVLKHGKSAFDFNFFEESDGTKRLFDLIDMILTDRPDSLFVVDELERSLHPKLTEHFLKTFMKAHENQKMQLVFTTQ